MRKKHIIVQLIHYPLHSEPNILQLTRLLNQPSYVYIGRVGEVIWNFLIQCVLLTEQV